jgi:hypothetical protein
MGTDKTKHRLAQMFLCIFLVSLNWFLVSVCLAEVVRSRQLIENAKEYDGKEIIFEGEAIGDIMERRAGAWINVSDGDLAIGIWMEQGLSEKISYSGDYKTRGDRVRIKGVFNKSCRSHGGDLDIHARELTILREGSRQIHPVSSSKRNLALILLGGNVCLIALILLKKRLLGSSSN